VSIRNNFCNFVLNDSIVFIRFTFLYWW
jgi:hypothetical protein